MTYFCSRCAFPSDMPFPTGLCPWCIKEVANWPAPQSYTCPRCGRVSYNPNDREHRYCSICKSFEEDIY
jgi:ribosomal protein L37E